VHKVKIVSLLLLSLLVPQAFYGLWTLQEESFVHQSDVAASQNIVVTGAEAVIERESWLLDIQYPVDDYANISSGWIHAYERKNKKNSEHTRRHHIPPVQACQIFLCLAPVQTFEKNTQKRYPPDS
jgi:hypothetical protein